MSGAVITFTRRVASLVVGFPGLHAINMILAIAFTLVQTLVLARVLDTRLFSQAVAATAVGLYLVPLNQSVARANFVLLRDRLVRHSEQVGVPEASAAFYGNQFILALASVGTPWLLGATTPTAYWSLAGFLFFSVYTNIWVTEMQMAMLATNRAMRFEYVNLLRRTLIFLTVGFLYLQRDFLVFTILAALQTALFHIYGLLSMAGDSRLFAWPRGLTKAASRAHLHRLWVSLQATLAEWLTFNAPYAVFTMKFGIGPGLIAIDVLLKLVRVVGSITRNLSEIALPKVSHAILSGAGPRARSSVLLVLAGAGLGAGILSLIMLVDGHLVFGFLLGPNDTVPDGAGVPAALAIVSTVGFTTGGVLIGHTGEPRMIRRLLLASVVGCGLFVAAMMMFPVTVLQGFWLFGASLAIVSVWSLLLLNRLVAPATLALSPGV
jgi:hypothetical protein